MIYFYVFIGRLQKLMVWNKEIVMKRLIYIVLSVFFLIQPVAADDKSDAEKMLKSKLDAAIEVLQKKDAEIQVKNKKIEEIMMPIFDFSLMAKLTLGRKYWPELTNENKDRFTELFTKLMTESYRKKLTRYTDEKIIYEPPTQIEGKIQIPTYLISKGQKTLILYKLYKSENDWKIYDIEIEGVSIIRSYQSQFDHILQTGTVDDLLLKMEKSVES